MQPVIGILDEVINTFEMHEIDGAEPNKKVIESLESNFDKKVNMLTFGFCRSIINTYSEINKIILSFVKMKEIFEFNLVCGGLAISVEIYLNEFVFKLINNDLIINKYQIKYINHHFDGKDLDDIHSFVIKKEMENFRVGHHHKIIYTDINYLAFGDIYNEDDMHEYDTNNLFRDLLFKGIASDKNDNIIGQTEWKIFRVEKDTIFEDRRENEHVIDPNRSICHQYFDNVFIRNNKKEYIDINEWLDVLSKINEVKSEFTELRLKIFWHYILFVNHDGFFDYCCKGMSEGSFYSFVCCDRDMKEIKYFLPCYRKFILILRDLIPKLLQ